MSTRFKGAVVALGGTVLLTIALAVQGMSDARWLGSLVLPLLLVVMGGAWVAHFGPRGALVLAGVLLTVAVVAFAVQAV